MRIGEILPDPLALRPRAAPASFLDGSHRRLLRLGLGDSVLTAQGREPRWQVLNPVPGRGHLYGRF